MSQKSNPTIDPRDPCYLVVLAEGVRPRPFVLERGQSVFIGSGTNCRLTLADEKINSIHCMVWVDEEKRMKVQDWNTGATYLNGKPVEEEAACRSGDRIKVGQYQLVPVLTASYHEHEAVKMLGTIGLQEVLATADPDDTEPIADSEASWVDAAGPSQESQDSRVEETGNLMSESRLAELSTSEAATNFSDPEAVSELHSEAPSEAQLETTSSTESADPFSIDAKDTLSQPTLADQESDRNPTGGFEYDVDADLKDDFDEDFDQFDNPFAGSLDGGLGGLSGGDDDNEDAELLRLELEQLRFELSERDHQIATLRERMSDSSGSAVVDESETEKLVTRLEELLEELQVSDDRVRNLEELLRLSDQATLAEQEERRQLESWVGEIEQRVQQHDSEQDAEIERLTQRLEESRQQAEHAEKQFRKLLRSQQEGTSAEESQQSAAVIAQCQEQIDQLKSQLESSREEIKRLESAGPTQVGSPEAEQENRELRDQIARLRVEASQERAEMARKHAELERIRDDLENRISATRQIERGDSRIKAMREHLREIHEKEKQETQESRQHSLGGRIANLLTKLK